MDIKTYDNVRSMLRFAEDDPSVFEHMVTAIAIIITPRFRTQLCKVVEKGPLWESDAEYPDSLKEMIDLGLAVHVCQAGQKGYVAGTNTAWSIAQFFKVK